MTPILGIWASQNYPRVTTSFESIATVTVGSGGSSSVTFSSIPATYKHLQIRILGRTDRSGADVDNIKINFNSDTGSNYYKAHTLFCDGSAAYASAEGSGTYTKAFRLTTDNVANTTTFGTAIVDILDIDSTNKNKTIRCLGGYDKNGAGEVWFTSGMWFATPAAITSIVLAPESGTNFKQYSHFALYGIRSA